MALIRNRNRRYSESEDKGIALDTIICAGGSSNVGSVLRDYAFESSTTNTSNNNANHKNAEKKYMVLAIGHNISNEEFISSCENIGIGKFLPKDETLDYFSRQRNMNEKKSLMKAYKITKEELLLDDSSFENAVIARIASKFHV
eukprot:CAMPEP_0184867714 /NCGR_PEP_ID=MMETSP0580-20130426/27491_1 /TAXON_ID=1118495 /ORGANISM="Dactyliosolen fragilissimus" /LENGTH=143 /DNA_ID=CAMNT_0027368141 /DNA_START=232 /DNA_END=663 /DNA_ORIENTATION=-